MTITSEKMKEARKAEVLNLLSRAEMTKAEIAKVLGWSSATTWHYVDGLHEQCQLSIASWEVKPTCMNPRFQTGCFPDAPKPVRVKRAEPDDEVERPWKREAVVVNVRRDPLVAALFGPHVRYVIRMDLFKQAA